ncbi:Spore maturation protein CgeB [Klenkia brasiliensis]|uniref:Spore maturation protein CgeB n=1 Tax=Klenkia brasiliensis TaxID=333142 RepID=A0A1G7YF49_9ACTN|nr:Spore maturation protein CgeB [Klenkia brasiliensis]
MHPGPEFSVSDVYRGWGEGLLACGAQVVTYDLARRLTFYDAARIDGQPVADAEGAVRLAAEGLLAKAWRTRPDVALVVHGAYVPVDVLDALRAGGVRVVLLHTESPYEDDRQLARAGHADLNVVNDPTHLGAFQAVAPSYFQPHAYRPAVHRPGTPVPELAADVTFVGTGFPDRIALLEAVDWSGVTLTLAGQWAGLAEGSPLRERVVHDLDECCPPQLTAALYASAGMSLNAYRREATRPDLVAGWAMGPREVELAAAGVFFAREPRPEGDELLPMLPTFTTPAELADVIAWSMAHPDLRQDAAAQARAVVADRTFHRSADRLLREIQKEN